MNNWRRLCAICLAVLLLAGCLCNPVAATSEQETILATVPPPQQTEETREVLPETAEYAFFADSMEEAESFAEDFHATLTNYQYGIATVVLAEETLQQCMQQSDVTLYPEQEYILQTQDQAVSDENPEQWHLPVLGAKEAWDYSGGEGVLVAVIDSGIDTDHADLKAAILDAKTTIPDSYYGNEGMFLPEFQGPQDNAGHGTHVAGIIAAGNNGFGCTGIAPDCRILSIKALEQSAGQGRGKSSWVAAAVNLAVEQGADIINMSMGGSTVKDKLLETAITRAVAAGVIVVCAAGNVKTPVVMYPAAYDGAVAVSALKPQGDGVTFDASYSNSGNWVDFCAPGSKVVSTVPGGYGAKSGTSMACAVVSGAYALLLSEDPLLTPRQADEILRQSALDLGEPGKDKRYGYGMTDLAAMMTLLQQRLQLQVPAGAISDGSTLYQGTPVMLHTQTLRARVVYTLDGTEPTAESPVWPDEGMIFPKNTETVSITAATLDQQGNLSEPVRFTYRFIPTVTDLESEEIIIADVIPGYAPYLDPVLQKPCRRYRITLESGMELVITRQQRDSDPEIFLFAGEDSDGTKLKLAEKAGQLSWKNKTKKAKTLILSLVQTAAFAGQDQPYSLLLSRQEIKAESPAKPTEPAPTAPVVTEPVLEETQPVPATEPTQPVVTTEPETVPQAAVIPEQEEDWLYTMEEPEQPVPTADAAEKGESEPMDHLEMQFLLAGGVVFLFGIALFLLGWKTGKKSRLLIRTGIRAQGTVVRILPLEHHTYRYQIAYTTQSGEKITASWNVYPRRRFVRNHPEGSQIGIKYLPESPKQFMVAHYPVTAFSSTVVLVVGIGVMALGFAIAMQMFL